MSEGQGGRPKKHLTDEHHFKPEEPMVEVPINPIVPSEYIISSMESLDVDTNVATNAESFGQSKFIESPAEEKIRELLKKQHLVEEIGVDSTYGRNDGWKPIDSNLVSDLPPRNGMPIRISEEPKGDGVLAQWKKTRAFANPTKRWIETGIWIDFMSGLKVNFEPKYWRERFV